MKIKAFLVVGMILIIGLVGGLAGCSAAGASAAGDYPPVNVNINSQQGITVNGQGKVSVAPDIAVLNVGVTAQADTVAEAQSQASEAMDKVMTALKNAGIDSKDIKTQYYNIYQISKPVVSYSSVRPAVAPGAPGDGVAYDTTTTEPVTEEYQYQVSNSVTVKIREIDKTGDIIDSVAEAGGDLIRIDGVYFSVDQPEKYHAQVRTAAMEDAKAKAESLAGLAGVTLGKATYVSESSYSGIPVYDAGYPVSYRMVGGAAPTTSISPGESEITLNVQVIYEIR